MNDYDHAQLAQEVATLRTRLTWTAVCLWLLALAFLAVLWLTPTGAEFHATVYNLLHGWPIDDR